LSYEQNSLVRVRVQASEGPVVRVQPSANDFPRTVVLLKIPKVYATSLQVLFQLLVRGRLDVAAELAKMKPGGYGLHGRSLQRCVDGVSDLRHKTSGPVLLDDMRQLVRQ
jgi:hypothetical protein